MQKTKIILCWLLLSVIVFAQNYNQKIDPAITQVLNTQREGLSIVRTDVVLKDASQFLRNAEGVAIEVLIKSSIDPSITVESLGGIIGSKHGDIYTAIIPLNSTLDIARSSEIEYIEASRYMYNDLDLSVPKTGADILHQQIDQTIKSTGKGVIIGFTDSGINTDHPTFKTIDGKTRILYVWDQYDAGNPPAGYIYGFEADSGMINDGSWSMVDGGQHGTHVAGIAAGNGLPLQQYVGMAPEADIIMVSNRGDDLWNHGLTSVGTLDGYDYIKNKANQLGKPFVINTSQGTNLGPHDGTTLFEQAVNADIANGAINTISAGNQGASGRHASDLLSEGVISEFEFYVRGGTGFVIPLDIWYETNDQIDFSLKKRSNPDTYSFFVEPDIHHIFEFDSVTVEVTSITNSGLNNDNQIYVTVTPKVNLPNNFYMKIGLKNTEGNALPDGGRVDLWWERNWSVAFLTNVDGSRTFGMPAGATEAITVASYNNRDGVGDISNFSGRGPRRDGLMKPDIAGIGGSVFSSVPGGYANFSGTSMSSPHLAGAVALLLEKNPNWTHTDVKDALYNNTITDAYTGVVPNNIWGHGKMNIFKAFQIAGTFPNPPLLTNVVVNSNDVTLTWNDPTTNIDGSTLTNLEKIYIYRNLELIDSVNAGVETYTDLSLGYGNYTYHLIAKRNDNRLSGISNSEFIVLFEKKANILLVDDDFGSYENYYEASLTNLGLAYDKWNSTSNGNVPEHVINNYLEDGNLIIWFTGDYVFLPENIFAVSSFLNNGGKLFISGQDIGWYLDLIGETSFYNNYLHANYVQDHTNIYGITGSGIFDGLGFSVSGGTGADNQLYMDEIDPINGAVTVLTYDPSRSINGDASGYKGNKETSTDATRGIISSGTAALSYEDVFTGSKLIYFAFGFEGIDAEANRNEVMRRSIEWLGAEIVPPVIEIDPVSITESLNEGDTTSTTITISNTGEGSLVWELDVVYGENSRSQNFNPILINRSQQEKEEILSETANEDKNSGTPTISNFSIDQLSNTRGSTKILVWNAFSDNSPGGEFENTMNAIFLYYQDFTFETTKTTDPVELENLLAGKNILIIPEQEYNWDLFSIGQNFKSVLENFLSSGKTLLVLDFSGETANLLSGTELMEISIQNWHTELSVKLAHYPSPILNGLPDNFTALDGTNEHYTVDSEILIVSSNNERPVLSFKSYLSGQIYYLGMDFYSYNNEMALLLSNIVKYAQSGFIEPSNTDGILEGGGSEVINLKLSAENFDGGATGNQFTADLKISHNDPDQDTLIVPVTLNVNPDNIAPAAVTDLAVQYATSNSVKLGWTATGDNGNEQVAEEYDLRYSTEPITEQNFDSATRDNSVNKPGFPGSSEIHTIFGLTPGTDYYFALKVLDEVPLASGISNVVQFTTPENIRDEVEPNDSAHLANVVALGDTILASIDPENDRDYYKLYAEAGDTVEVYAEHRNDSYLFGMLRIFRDNGNYLQDNTFFTNNFNKRRVFVAPYTGDYYIRFSNWNNYGSFPDNITTDDKPESITRKNDYFRPHEQPHLFPTLVETHYNSERSKSFNNHENLTAKANDNIHDDGERAYTGDYFITFNHFQKQAPIAMYTSLFDINYNSFRVSGQIYPNGLTTDVYLDYGENDPSENSVLIGSYNALNSINFSSGGMINFVSPTGNVLYKLRTENSLGTSETGIYGRQLPQESQVWSNLDLDVTTNNYPYRYIYGVDFYNANTGFITGYLHDGFYFYNIGKTTDRGESWEFMRVGDYEFFDIEFITRDKIIAVGSDDQIAISEDGGTTWNSFQLSTDSWYTLYDVEFFDQNNGLIVGEDWDNGGGVWRTTDGGANWEKINTGLTNIYRLYDVEYLTQNKIYAVGYSGGAFSNDGGLTWTWQDLPEFVAIDFYDQNIGFALDGAGNGTTNPFLWKTTDGGVTWNSVVIDLGSYFYFYMGDITFIDQNKVVIIGEDGAIIRSDDQGGSWYLEESGTRNQLFDIVFADGQNGWIVGDYGTILRTGNGAYAEWETVITANDAVDRSIDEITFGQSIMASDGIDEALGEEVLSSAEPGALDLRFSLPDNITESKKDFRSAEHRVATWKFSLQPGENGYPVILTWDPSTLPLGRFTLSDEAAREIYLVDMKDSSSLVITDDAVTTFKIEYKFEICEQITMLDNWNLTSIPVIADDMTPQMLFPDLAGEVYEFDSGYKNVELMTPGKGYWVKYGSDEVINVCGNIIGDTVNLNSGWNLVGVYETDIVLNEVTFEPAGIVNSKIYGFDSTYYSTNLLKTGEGYWLKTSDAGKMLLNMNRDYKKGINELNKIEQIDEDWNSITVNDSKNKVRNLYLGKVGKLGSYELPPLPPAGVFDVRYSDNKYVRELNDGTNYLLISGANYPVTITVHGADVRVKDIVDGSIINQLIRDGEQLVISDKNINKLQIEAVELPVEFTLYQNYPNPFNPSTIIKYGIPEDAKVKIDIFNALGQRVRTLIDTQMEAGYHEMKLNANELASGVYFYRIQAGSFIDTKKMLLIK